VNPVTPRLDHLFRPLTLGNLNLPNRIIMGPMSRYRCRLDGTATDAVAQHFADRASAGLLICEPGYVHPSGRLGAESGGMADSTHVRSWKRVTDAVHERGGRIFMQLIHGGRVSAPELQADGGLPWAPSAVAARDDRVRVEPNHYGAAGTPRAMSRADIATIVESFAAATERAHEAGFDGVELHGGNGYLVHQFLSSNVNRRGDEYGGSVANRCRLILDLVDAMVAKFGPEYVGVKLTPVTSHHEVVVDDRDQMYDHLLRQLDTHADLAYLSVQSTMGFLETAPPPIDVFLYARERYSGTLLAAANLDRYSGEGLLASGTADAAVYGRRFIANPDLVGRFSGGHQENLVDWDTAILSGESGYNDYPTIHRASPLAECAERLAESDR